MFSNCPPYSSEQPGGRSTPAETAACTSAAKRPRSRPRTLASTVRRRWMRSRLIWAGPSSTRMSASCDSGSTRPPECSLRTRRCGSSEPPRCWRGRAPGSATSTVNRSRGAAARGPVRPGELDAGRPQGPLRADGRASRRAEPVRRTISEQDEVRRRASRPRGRRRRCRRCGPTANTARRDAAAFRPMRRSNSPRRCCSRSSAVMA